MTELHHPQPSACTGNDLPELIKMVDSVMRQGSDQSMLTDYPLVYLEDNLANIFMIKKDGRIAAEVPFIPRSVSFDGCGFDVGIISPTATHPDYRKKGYGLACLKCCTGRMEHLGIELSLLWTSRETFPFYEYAGYQAVRTQAMMYILEGEDAKFFFDYGYRVAEYNPADRRYLPDIMELHQGEHAGIVRREEQYPYLFALPKMKTLLALQKNRPVAYLTASRAHNKPGLIEAAGDSRAVETLFHHALSQLPADEAVRAYAYLWPSVTGELLEWKFPERRQPWDGNMMVRINCVLKFLRGIRLFLERQNGGKRRSFSIKVADTDELISFAFTYEGLQFGDTRQPDHAELTLRQLTSIIFGENTVRREILPGFLAGLFPFYFPIWILDHS